VGSVEPLRATVVEGLPVIAAASVPDFPAHADPSLGVRLSADALAVDWSGGTPIDLVVRHERLFFLVGQNELLGAVVTNLSARETDQCVNRTPIPGLLVGIWSALDVVALPVLVPV